MKFSSFVRRLPIRVLGPLIMATALFVYTPLSAQTTVNVFIGNPECLSFNVAANGDIEFPVWLEYPYPIGVGLMRFYIADSVVTEWVGVNFVDPWQYNYSINGNTLVITFFPENPFPDTVFHLADLIFAIDADSSYYDETVQAITGGAFTFGDTGGYYLLPYFSCISPLYIQRQTSTVDPVTLPTDISHTAYPNPFNSSVAFSISLPHEGNLDLTIYDIAGREVRRLFQGTASGNIRFVWDGVDDNGRQVSSGFYFYRVEYDNKASASKITLLR